MKRFIMFILVTITAIITMTGCAEDKVSLTVIDSTDEESIGNRYEIVETENIETETIIVENYDY